MLLLEWQVVLDGGRLQPARLEQRPHQRHRHGVRRATLAIANREDAGQQLASRRKQHARACMSYESAPAAASPHFDAICAACVRPSQYRL